MLRVNLDDGEGTFQVFGAAPFTDDFDSNGKSRHVNRLSWFKDSEIRDIHMHAVTIYVLLA
jgi:hypothetical protein